MSAGETVEGIILAAGSSTRIGAFKPGLMIGGKSMLVRCVVGMSSVCGRIVVVGGDELDRLRSLVAGYATVECIENPLHHRGMFSSVKSGLAVMRGDRCFILPSDMPLVPPAVYRLLLEEDADVVIPVYHGKKGHPVCLSKTVVPRILREPDDSSLRDAIKAIGHRNVEVDAEEILIDVDTPQDYEEICRRLA